MLRVSRRQVCSPKSPGSIFPDGASRVSLGLVEAHRERGGRPEDHSVDVGIGLTGVESDVVKSIEDLVHQSAGLEPGQVHTRHMWGPWAKAKWGMAGRKMSNSSTFSHLVSS